MRRALEDARLPVDKIQHVNAHATATEAGDIAESQATHSVFGERVPVSAFKGSWDTPWALRRDRIDHKHHHDAWGVHRPTKNWKIQIRPARRYPT
jgi:hypothetical protein